MRIPPSLNFTVILSRIILAVALITFLVRTVKAASEWADSQNTFGEIQVTSGSADLYVCEPTGTSGDPICPGDDSGADEIIFEGDEDMVPFSVRNWDLRLVNNGDLAWDVHEIIFTLNEVADPNSDCDVLPTGQQTGFFDAPPGFPTLIALAPDADDHTSAGGGRYTPPFEFMPNNTRVHVAPGDYEDIRIASAMPGSLPTSCRGNVWSMSFSLVVEPHQ